MNNYLISTSDKEMSNIFLDSILKDIKDYEIINYNDAESIILAIDDLNTISMFDNIKVVIKEDTLDFNKDEESILNKYLDSSNDNYLILLVKGNIDKRKKIVKYFVNNSKYYSDSDYDFDNYIINYLKDKKYKIEDTKYLLSYTGNNINNINNELDKLVMYKDEDKFITNKDIDLICVKDLEDNIFAFTDAIIKEEKDKSMNLYKEFLLQGYDESYLIVILANQFRSLFKVKKLYNDGKSYDDISKILKFNNPYRAKAIHKNSYNYSIDCLISYLKKLGDMDYKIKSGKADKKQLFELFLINKDL